MALLGPPEFRLEDFRLVLKYVGELMAVVSIPTRNGTTFSSGKNHANRCNTCSLQLHGQYSVQGVGYNQALLLLIKCSAPQCVFHSSGSNRISVYGSVDGSVNDKGLDSMMGAG